jgi:hypothetical protein
MVRILLGMGFVEVKQSGSQNSARNGVIEDDVTADREAAQPVRLFRDNEVGWRPRDLTRDNP